MKVMRMVMVLAVIVAVTIGIAVAQAPQGGPGAGAPGAGAPGGGQGRGGGAPGGGGGGRGQRGPALSVTSTAWPDGGEVPMKHAGRGENKSPAFEFKWYAPGGMTPAEQPANVQSFAVIFHDAENSTNRGTADTLHWMAWDIPATAKGLAEGLAQGDLPDGTKQSTTNVGQRGGYFGPGAGPGPFHHYIFEFYALDAKLNLPNTATRQEVLAAMEGKIVGKSVFVGRFRGMPAQ